MSKVRGKFSCLLINDIDAGIGHFKDTQVTVNNQVRRRDHLHGPRLRSEGIVHSCALSIRSLDCFDDTGQV